MKKLIIAIIILLVAGLILFQFATKERKSPDQPIVATLKPVEARKVQRRDIQSELQLSGTIESNSQVTVFPKIAGEIIEMRVDEGVRVKKGETLSVIEHQELELQVRQVEAAYRATKTAHEQAKKLAEVRVRSEIAQAEARRTAAEVSLQQVVDLAKIRTTSQIEQSVAGLVGLQANLEKLKRGARDEDRKQAQATVDQAKANLANATSNYKRMQKLLESEAISTQSFEGAQTQLDVAQAQYNLAVEQMRLIKNGAREEDIRAMEAQVKQAEAILMLARAQVATETWQKDMELAKSQVDVAQAALDVAQALESAKSWEAEIVSAETTESQAKAALDLAQKRLKDATITAPITGIISKKYLDLGGMASPTAPIFELVDIDTVKATVSVIESDLGKLKLKSNARIQVDALFEPIDGEVTFISPTLEPASRTVTVEITIDNADMRLKPGMFAKVNIPIEIYKNAILIPRSAAIEDRGENTQNVFVVVDGVSKRRQVELGLMQGSDVEIRNGLSDGEMVVTAGHYSLKDGEKVTVVNP